MSKAIIYGAGLLIVTFILGLLAFLTIDNFTNSQVIYGTRNGSFSVNGLPSILVNVGILGLITSFVSYIFFLFKRSTVFLKSYKIIGTVSGALIGVGLLCGQA